MLKALTSYSILAVPLAFIGLPVYINAPEYYATEFNISIADIGFALLLLRAFDAIQDPLIGRISDKFAHLRQYFVYLGLLILAIGFWALFNPQNPSMRWFCFAVILSTSGYSIANINYLALGGLWQVKQTDSSKITSWREAFGLLGLILAASLPSFFSQQRLAYEFISISLIPVIILAGICFSNWHRNTKFLNKTISDIKLKANRWNIAFFSIYLINCLASSIPAVLVVFFIKDNLQESAKVGLFLLTYFVSGAAAMPVWHYLGKRLSKTYAWMIGMIIASISFVWAFNLNANNAQYFFIICLISGAALGADLAMPPAILADKIQQEQLDKQASQYFAGINFLNKIALALAAGICLPLLAKLGYEPGKASHYLSYAYALIPSIIKIIAAVMLYRFSNRSKNATWSNNYGV